MTKILTTLLIFFILSIPFSGPSVGMFINYKAGDFWIINIFALFSCLSFIIFLFKSIIKRRKITISLLGYQFIIIIFITGLSLLYHNAVTDMGVSLFLMLIFGFLTYFIIYNYVVKFEDIKWISYALFFIFAAQGILATIQFFNPELIKTPVIVPLGDSNVARADGTIGHPGPFGVFMAMIWPLALSKTIFLKKGLKKNLFIWLIVLILGTLGIVFSLTRSAWIGLFVSFFVIFIYSYNFKLIKKRHFFHFSIFIIIIILIFPLFSNSKLFKDRFFSSDTLGQIRFRLNLNRIAFEMIRDHPFLGIGVGKFTALIGDYTPYLKRKVHNEYLYWLTEYGILGFLFFAWFIITIIKLGHRATKKLKNFSFFYLALGINSAILGLLVVNNSGLAMSHISIFLLFCVFLGLESSIIKISNEHRKK